MADPRLRDVATCFSSGGCKYNPLARWVAVDHIASSVNLFYSPVQNMFAKFHFFVKSYISLK